MLPALARGLARAGQRAAAGAGRRSRGLHGGRAARGEHHPDDPHYIHAPNMYEIWNMPNRKLVFGSMTVACLVGGFGIPGFAVNHSQKKLAG